MINGQKVKGGVYSGVVKEVKYKKTFFKNADGKYYQNWIIKFEDGFEGENLIPDHLGVIPDFKVGQEHSYKVDYASAFGTEIVNVPKETTPKEVLSALDAYEKAQEGGVYFLPSPSPVRDQLPVIALEIAVKMLPENTEELLRDTDVILQWLKDSTK